MLIFDLVNPQELQGYIRGLAYEENLYRFTLSAFLPETNVQDTEFRVTRGNLLDQDAATFRAFDTESPIARRLAGTRITGQLPPLSRKVRLGEEERLRLEAVRTGDTSALVQEVYNDAANMTRAVLARIELARGQALVNGGLTIAENGIAATITYGRRASHSVVPPTLWSDLANSDPISDLRNWQQTYLLDTGILPAYAIVSTAIASNLLRNSKVRTLASSIAGAPAIVSQSALNQVLDAFGLPQLFAYDTRVRVDGVSQRVIPDNVVIFMPPDNEPLGGVFMGITAEALELVNAGYLVSSQAPGLVSVVEKTYDPVATWTKTGALALPVLANPDLTLVSTVQ